MPEDKVQIAFKGTEGYRLMLQTEALKRNVKVQQLLEAAVLTLLSGAHSVSAPTERPNYPYIADHKQWHDMLDRILTRGTDRQQLGIQSNLEAFDANLPALRRGKAG